LTVIREAKDDFNFASCRGIYIVDSALAACPQRPENRQISTERYNRSNRSAKPRPLKHTCRQRLFPTGIKGQARIAIVEGIKRISHTHYILRQIIDQHGAANYRRND